MAKRPGLDAVGARIDRANRTAQLISGRAGPVTRKTATAPRRSAAAGGSGKG